MRQFLIGVCLVLVALLPGCGGGGEAGSGALRLSVTDAPVDGATSVVVQFSGVQVQAASGERLAVNFKEPKQIDLLALQGGRSETLLGDTSLPAGHYSWLRIEVDSAYIAFSDDPADEYELRIPSGAETGLKLNRGFDVPDGRTADFTIDFDLRKSVHLNPSGTDCVLRPTLRMVDNTQSGSISGTVDPALLAGPSCDGGAVYVYQVDTAQPTGAPDDIGGAGEQPLTTAPVIEDADGRFTYKVGFIPTGTYAVAFTCQAREDDPDTDDPIAFPDAAFVTVSAGADTVLDFFKPA